MNARRSRLRTAGCLAFAALVVLLPGSTAEAAILGSSELTIDFTKPDDAAEKARWDKDDVLRCGEKGLGWGSGPKDEDAWRDLRLRTTKPLALGVSYRPTTNANVRVTLEWAGRPARQARGHLWVRHSPDAENWSEWRDVPLHASDLKASVLEYRTELRVPSEDRELYEYRLRRYQERDVPWKSDEEAAVAWMLEGYPDLFERRKPPFLGYLQLLYESEVRGRVYLKTLRAQVSWQLPGPTWAPKGGTIPTDRDGPWRFRADEFIKRQLKAESADIKQVFEAILRYAKEEDGGSVVPRGRVVTRMVVPEDIEPWNWEKMNRHANWDFDRRAKRIRGLREETLASFKRRTRYSHAISGPFELGFPVLLWPREDRRRFAQGGTSDDYWTRFYERFPGTRGLYRLTMPGFDAERSQALVQVHLVSGYLHGVGHLYLLRKRDDRWTVSTREMMFVN